MSEISVLIPHQGGMCLLERVVSFDDTSVRCATTTHRHAENPLRRDGRLSAVHLCEYGAQAMAVHGGLLARRAGAAAKPGLLVSLRGVRFALAHVDQLDGELVVEAERLVESEASWQYAFRITHAGELVCEGRAAVMMA
ncbi:MAG TPA: phosphotransferase [Xanthomonadales bacterium]|nr:phosphotransferase [Xanthomonadales bacterium]